MTDLIKGFTYLVRHKLYGMHIYHTVKVLEVDPSYTKIEIIETTNSRIVIGERIFIRNNTTNGWLMDYKWTLIEPVYEDLPLTLGKHELEYMIELALATHDKEWFNQLTKQMEVSQ